MVNDLIDALENKVHSAVDTIGVMRSEINELKEERQALQDKLRELLSKMDVFQNGNGASTTPSLDAQSDNTAAAPASDSLPYGRTESDF